MVQAVFFDVGNTLLYPCPNVAETFASVAVERGHAMSVHDVEQHMPAMNAFYEAEYIRDGDFWCSHEGSTAIWLDQYRYVCHLMGIEQDAEGMAQAVHTQFRSASHWALYPDVLPCLQALKKRGFALGVVSNWDSGLEALLRDLRLLPYFDTVVSSAVVGYRKPNPLIFELAGERLAVKPEHAVHVGDHPHADGQGAREAGFSPCIISRGNAEKADEFTHVASLSEIPELLQ